MNTPASTASAITDEQIEATFKQCGGRWADQSYWQIEDADLHPFARAVLALAAPTAQPTGQAEGETPFAYYVHFPDADRGELVHDLDELTEDLTNERHEITPLYTRPVAAVEPSQPAENARLRQIISECAAALGNGSGISPECSVEFMGHLPEEIRAVIASTPPAPAAPSLDAWHKTDAELAAIYGEMSAINETPRKEQSVAQADRLTILRQECVAICERRYRRAALAASTKGEAS